MTRMDKTIFWIVAPIVFVLLCWYMSPKYHHQEAPKPTAVVKPKTALAWVMKQPQLIVSRGPGCEAISLRLEKDIPVGPNTFQMEMWSTQPIQIWTRRLPKKNRHTLRVYVYGDTEKTYIFVHLKYTDGQWVAERDVRVWLSQGAFGDFSLRLVPSDKKQPLKL